MSLGQQINIDKEQLGYFIYKADSYPSSWKFYYLINELDDDSDYELTSISIFTKLVFKAFLENNGFHLADITDIYEEWSGDKDEYELQVHC